jgi:hypothetical protein
VEDFPLWLKILVWLIVGQNSDLDHHGQFYWGFTG